MNVNPSAMAVGPGKTNLAALFCVRLNQLFCWLISRRSHFPAGINQKMPGTPRDWRGLAIREWGIG